MSHEEFVTQFECCLEELPDRDRKDILRYWKLFHVAPEINTDDSRIPKKHEIKKAAVAGMLCLNMFFFRNYIVSLAPESIRKTIIKHELAHCLLWARDPRHNGQHVRRRRDSVSMLESSLAKIHDEMELFWAKRADEFAASRQNQIWGSDEAAAHEWCDAYILQNPQVFE